MDTKNSNAPEPSLSSNRNIGIDLVRIFAVALVLVRHLKIPDNSHAWLAFVHRGGWVGVDVFFVLSGFLVTGLLLREHRIRGNVHVGRFLIRRGLKIYPPFYLLIVATIIGHAALNIDINSRSLASEILFIQNYFGRLWNHTWSLAVEEHFYLFLALLFWIFRANKKFTPKLIPWLFFAAASACLILRIVESDGGHEFSFRRNFSPTHLRIDSLLFGSFLSYLYFHHDLERRASRVPAWLFVGAGCTVLLPPFLNPVESSAWMHTWGFSLFFLGAGMLVVAAVRLKETRNKYLKLISSLGASSYSIYLWHMPINIILVWFLEKLGVPSFSVYCLVYLLGSLAVGHLLNRVIETPTLKLRDRLFPR